MTIYLVRHAKAGDRSQWQLDDWLRPLSRAGRSQARALLDVLHDARFDRVLSSPYLRCVETVAPIAAARRLAIEPDDALAEGGDLDSVFAIVRKHIGTGALALQSRRRDPGGAVEPRRRRYRPGAGSTLPEGLHLGARGRTRHRDHVGAVRSAAAGPGRVSTAPRPVPEVEPIETLAALLDVLAAGVVYDDEEDVDLLAHALQCAHRLRASRARRCRAAGRRPRPRHRHHAPAHAPERHARIGADAVRGPARRPGRPARERARRGQALPRSRRRVVPRRPVFAQHRDPRGAGRPARRTRGPRPSRVVATSRRSSRCAGPTTKPRFPAQWFPTSIPGAPRSWASSGRTDPNALIQTL